MNAYKFLAILSKTITVFSARLAMKIINRNLVGMDELYQSVIQNV